MHRAATQSAHCGWQSVSAKKEGDTWKDHIEWVSVVCFGKTAENAGQFLAKGRQCYVEGKLQTRSYKDKDGNEKYTTEVVAHQVLFLGGGQGADKGAAPKSQQAGTGATESNGSLGFIDDDLPF